MTNIDHEKADRLVDIVCDLAAQFAAAVAADDSLAAHTALTSLSYVGAGDAVGAMMLAALFNYDDDRMDMALHQLGARAAARSLGACEAHIVSEDGIETLDLSADRTNEVLAVGARALRLAFEIHQAHHPGCTCECPPE